MQCRFGLDVRHDDQVLHRGQCVAEVTGATERVDVPAAVAIAISGNEHPGLDLSEAIEHTFVAEVG